MPSSISKLTDLTFPGVIVVALSVITYYTTRPSLTSARPDSSTYTYKAEAPLAPQGMAAIHSRIWEDPLRTHDGPDPASSLSCDVEPANVAHVLRRRVADASQFTCLAVLVPGGPDAESQEQRIRMRYAVVSALTQSGFSLKYNSRLTYADIDGIAIAIGGSPPTTDTPPIKVRVPFKLYVKHPTNTPNEEHRVLVCWINDLALGEMPLDALRQIMDKLFPVSLAKRDKVALRIIGPASSDMLDSMLKPGGAPWTPWNNELPQLWSARATRASAKNERQLLKCKGIDFRRAIGNDVELQHALRWELSLRNAWPTPGTNEKIVILTEIDTSYGRAWTHEGISFQKEPPTNPPSPDPAPSPTCLTVETSQLNPVSVSLPPALEPNQISVFSYLRGIDGRTFHTADPKNDNNQQDRRNDNDPQTKSAAQILRSAPFSTSEPHTGPAQLDYLRRLEQHLTLQHDAQSIKAIGVIGTDVYDKLLILRALRPHFPNTVFFTTDLDVELWHPAERAWTRNLVVASHYGLSPGKYAISSTPGTVDHPTPFRDSYQTATFYAVRQAVEAKQNSTTQAAAEDCVSTNNNHPQVAPDASNHDGKSPQSFHGGCLLFEIGADGPFHLATLNAAQDMHPPTSHSPTPLLKRIQQFFVVLMLLLVPGWAGIRFIIYFVELFKRAWRPLRGPFHHVHEFVERALSGLAARIGSRRSRRLRRCLSVSAFLSVCAVVLFLIFDLAATLLILIGLTTTTLLIVAAWRTTRWDVYFFAFTGTIVLALLLHRYSFFKDGASTSWALACFIAGGMMVGMTVSAPLRKRSSRVGKHLHAMFRVNLLGRQASKLPQAQRAFHDSDTITPYWIIVLATLVLAATAIATYCDQLTVTGEPFTSAGISMWPVTFARAGLFLFACMFIVTCISSLAQSAMHLSSEYLGQYVPATTLPPVWRQFFDRRFLKASAHPAMPMVWAFFAGSYLFFALTSFPSNPSRGLLCFATSQAVMYCTVISMALLSFVVFEAVQSVRACVKMLKEQLGNDSSICPDTMLARQARQWHVSPDKELRPAIEGLTIVRLLAERTRTVGKLLLYPAWIVLGTALIRLSWLDNLGVSWQLLLVLGILVFFPVAFYARLRLEVHRIREQINDRLARLKSALTASGDSAELRQLAILKDAIDAENRGAFSPMARDPIFAALSIPFGGAGSLMLIQDLMSNF